MEDAKALIDLLFEGVVSMFRDHPRPLIIVFLLGIIFAYFFYQERISVLKERIDGYQQRLGEVPKETTYTALTNRDLKREALKLISKVRDFRQAMMTERMTQQRNFEIQKEKAQSVEQKQAIHQQSSRVLMQSIEAEHEKFRREFVGPIRALSAAMWDRFPQHEKQYQKSYSEIFFNTQTFVGPDPVGEAANSLEKFAEQLPIPPYDWFSLRWQDALFTFCLLTGVIFWTLRQCVLWRYRNFLRPISSPSNFQEEKNLLESKIKDLTEQNKSLAPQQWLSDLAKENKTMVEKAVLILGCKMELHLDEGPAYISFEFNFYNASVYPILLNTVEGFILFGKRKLEKEIVISTKWAPVYVSHTRSHSIELLQYLTKEEADIIRHDRTESDPKKRTGFQFNFKHLRIMIDGGINGESIVSKPLRFHRDAAITLEGKLIAI